MTEALDRLKQATRKYLRLSDQTEKAKREVLDAALGALRDGETPNNVAEASPFTAGYLRKIARENGVEPAKRGVKPRRK
ncbi:hypothetical protein [Nocardia rhizosphaerae]|uniref:Transcriptional regulator n=1 Tax=Nocardia rhizosphaerae TaxID=1691571 RepID=A0ABV8LFB5_9NOCA